MAKTHGEVLWVDGRRIASPEYRSWQMMKNRCLNPKARDYRYYGGRGIKICRRWQDSFEAFLEDMGRKPTPAHTLDRKNSDGPYNLRNCRWATREEQSRNRPYASVKAWLLAARLGVKTSTARHMIGQVRAKDRGDLSWFALSPEREKQVRKFLKERHGPAI